MDPERTRQARALFAGIAPEYDRMGSVLSLGRDPSWRRFLVSRVNAIPGSWVLDVATGTGLVARELAARNVRVVGVDQSPAMLRRGPAATLRELARVLRPGSVMASLEFHVPQDPWVQAGWYGYTRAALPVIGGAVSNEWYRTGRFLGPSISEFYRRYPVPVQVRMWQEAGIRRVRTKQLTLGSAIVTWGIKANPLTHD